MIDLIYLTHNRLEFTQASLAALISNTSWENVARLLVYDDDSRDGTRQFLEAGPYPIAVELRCGGFGSPVAVMADYLNSPNRASIFGKIDNDTMVPTGWLDECLAVMGEHPELALLGIEVFDPITPGQVPRSYRPARFIGGIGLMRASAFITVPGPNGRFFGFTEWQEKHKDVTKGWLVPALPVFLLDHLPREPWLSLTREYVAKGWQRNWTPYSEESRDMWSWWCK